MRLKSDMMGTMPLGRLIATMSIPLMISMLIQSTYNIVDSFFVAKLGMEAINALGIAFPIQMLMIASANGLGVGMNALISQRFGRGEGERAPRAAGNNILMTGILALIFVLFGLFGCGAYLRASSSDARTIAYGVEYLQIVTIGGGGIFYVILAERLLQVTGKTTLSMLTQASGAVINIVLDPILIFGLLGFPPMGIRGAAVATIAGQCFGALLGFILHWRVNREIRIKRGDLRLDGDAVQICKVGLPVTVTMSMSSVMVFAMNKLLAAHMEIQAVFNVFYRLQSFLFMPTSGMMQGLIPIIGYNYGAKNGPRLRQTIRLAAIIAFCIMVLGLVFCQLFPGQIMGLFDNGENAQMVSLGIQALRTIAWVFPVAGVAMVCANLFQGMGNGVPGLIYGLGRQCVVLLPAAWLILRFFSPEMVWYAFWIGELLTAGLIALIFSMEYKKRVSPLLAVREDIPETLREDQRGEDSQK